MTSVTFFDIFLMAIFMYTTLNVVISNLSKEISYLKSSFVILKTSVGSQYYGKH